MGSLAALSAGKATTATVAASTQEGESDGTQVGTNSNHLPNYANRAGRINHEGLQQALDDYSNGTISQAERDAVIDAFSTGERVVSKDVRTIASDINEDTVLEKNPDDPSGEAVVWQFDGSIDVNAELEIQDGVVMEFTQGSAMNVQSGPLLANGTNSEGIFATGTAARQGWYGGIYVESTDLQNSMEHMLVEYGGRGSYRGCLDIASDGTDNGSMAVTNCTLRWSGEYGLYQGGGGTLLDEGDNVYADNREAGVRTLTSNIHEYSPSSAYNNNDRNYVFVAGNTASDEGPDEETRTWSNLEVPYRMQGGHSIDNLTLDIEPGTELEFSQQSNLTFESSSRIDIEGTDTDKVVFTAATNKRGWWNGVYIDDTTDTENLFNHCVFEYAGNTNWTAALEVATGGTDDGAVEVRNCVFRDNDGFGINVGGGTDLRNFENNTYTSNVDGAARIGTANMQSLSSTSDFTGNDNDYVLVYDNGVNGNGRNSDQRRWDAINVPWRMDGYHNVDNLELSIEPGADFAFTEAAGLQFDGGSRLRISGFIDETEESDPITFTGTDEQRGWWRGIYLNDTTDQENLMEYVIIEYAGAEGWDGGLDLASGGTDSAYLQFNNCTFQNCARYGVRAGGGGIIENLSSNLYTGNGEGAMYIPTYDVEALSDSSDFTGNDNDFVRVWNGGINGDGAGSDSRSWDAINVPLRLEGFQEIDNVEFSIDPGATLEFTENSGLSFQSGSVFILQGTANDQITFTGTDATQGWWSGIYINETQSRKNRLEHVIVEYAGNGQNQLDIASGGTDNGQIEEISNCTFRNGEGYGIEWGNGAYVRNMSNNLYTNNTEGAVLTRTENMDELDDSSDFTGNDKDRVVVKTATLESGDAFDDPPVWDALNVPYEMRTGNHEVDTELEVAAGARIEFQEEARLRFQSSSQIRMLGESDNEILLTGTDDAREFGIKGWWYGVYMDDATSQLNRFEHVTVEWAGRNGPGAVDIASGGTDNGFLALENCTIRKSSTSGLYAQNAASTNSDVCSVNTFEDNDGQDCFIDN